MELNRIQDWLTDPIRMFRPSCVELIIRAGNKRLYPDGCDPYKMIDVEVVNQGRYEEHKN